MTTRRSRATGVTLPELMVVLVLLGLMAAIVGLAWRNDPARTGASRTADGRDSVAMARHQALTSGRVVRTHVTIDGRSVTIAALPDGRILAPSELGLDPLTGLPRHD